MAKRTALGDSFYVGAIDLSGDVGAINSLSTPRAVIDVSPLNNTGYERLLGRVDGTVEFNSYFNPASSRSHPTLSAVGTASGTANTIVTYAMGATIGNPIASLSAKQVDYRVTVNADLSISTTASALAANNAPVEWGVMLTSGKETYASAGTASATVDGGAATSFGATAYLHVFSIASGTATVKIQDSADDSTYADVTGLTFTAASAATYERLATAGTATIRRYRRLVITGTFTDLVLAVNLHVFATSQT